MGVGKVILCSHGPSSIVWSENEPRCGTIAYFVDGKKEGRIWFNTIYLIELYQFERNTWWCMSVLESILESIMLKKILKRVMVSQNLRRKLNENSGRPWNLIHSLPCKTPCRLFIHEVFFGPLGLHLRVWSELGCSTPFRPMRALGLQRSRASVLCVKWPLDFNQFICSSMNWRLSYTMSGEIFGYNRSRS
jgi:hypothetical protein